MKLVLLVSIILHCFIYSFAQDKNSKYHSVSSPLKMNVVYIGVDNPFEIMVNDLAAKKMIVKVSQGSIVCTGPYNYTIRVVKPGKLTISVYAVHKKDTLFVENHEFRAKRIPDPVPKIAGLKGGMINKNLLWAQSGIIATLENFDFDLRFEVCGYTFVRNDTLDSKIIEVSGWRFTPEIVFEIQKCQKGRKIFFENIKAKCPDGEIRDIGSISFMIQ